MTRTELEWVRSAFALLYRGQVSQVQEAKVLRTIAQIFSRAAEKAEAKIFEQVDEVFAQNHLVNLLRESK